MKKILITMFLGLMGGAAYAADFSDLQSFRAQDVNSLAVAVPAPAAGKGAYNYDYFEHPGIGLITQDALGQNVYSYTFGDKLAVMPANTGIWAWFADASCAAGAGYAIEVENFSKYKEIRVSYKKAGVMTSVQLTPSSTIAYLPGSLSTLYVDACNGGINNGLNPVIKIGVFSTTCSEKYSFSAKVYRDKWGDARMDSAMAIATINKN